MLDGPMRRHNGNEGVYSPFVLYKERVTRRKSGENVINKTFNLPLDNTAYKYESAVGPLLNFVEINRLKQVRADVENILYLNTDARQAVLEAIYGNYP
jgi:hypothetical protein